MGRHLAPLSLIVAAFACVSASATPSQELTVCATCSLRTVGQAIEAAPAGAIIRVRPGTYRERGLIIKKPLHIRGEPGAIIDAQGAGDVLVIQGEDIEVSGLSLRNSGQSYIEDLAGLKVVNSKRCRLSDNTLLGNTFAIHVANAEDCAIERNVIKGSTLAESAAGNGIHVWQSRRISINHNQVEGHRDGIYFEFVTDSSIVQNTSRGNLRYGMHFMFSDRDEYRQNTFSINASGVAVMYSKNIIMLRNTFELSSGAAAYGILLKDISASEIRANRFLGNTVGAYLEGTTRSRFEGNLFEANGWALRVLGNCDSNTFTGNDFVANTFDASTNSSSSQNRFERNFWSAYTGLDLDHDGFGDTAYRPVKLSSVLMERYGTSMLLLKSFFFTIADEAESALPVLTPEAFRDERPLIRRVGSGI